MRVYDFEHHGYGKAITDYLNANTEGLPREALINAAEASPLVAEQIRLKTECAH